MMYNTHTTPSRPMMHASASSSYIHAQHHKYILPRSRMGIFFRTKFASPSECKCDCDALNLTRSDMNRVSYINFSKCVRKWRFSCFGCVQSEHLVRAFCIIGCIVCIYIYTIFECLWNIRHLKLNCGHAPNSSACSHPHLIKSVSHVLVNIKC